MKEGGGGREGGTEGGKSRRKVEGKRGGGTEGSKSRKEGKKGWEGKEGKNRIEERKDEIGTMLRSEGWKERGRKVGWEGRMGGRGRGKKSRIDGREGEDVKGRKVWEERIPRNRERK
ncbi:hypothetical protein Pcinc_022655 [Petrolisthes cinctipes]|uniref:Uncharacterized protein n=1 Tax=Petrolisthes cinctipes TaxID=88211 RepID=A0AAE1FDT5_PETCI|nr:hypothetical protein Pcinc_022655 [Petrolisthes cinctipes]